MTIILLHNSFEKLLFDNSLYPNVQVDFWACDMACDSSKYCPVNWPIRIRKYKWSVIIWHIISPTKGTVVLGEANHRFTFPKGDNMTYQPDQNMTHVIVYNYSIFVKGRWDFISPRKYCYNITEMESHIPFTFIYLVTSQGRVTINREERHFHLFGGQY